MTEGKTIKYALRDKKSGHFVVHRKERNPRDRYACCETSHYISIPENRIVDSPYSVWLLDTKEQILEVLTKDTKYYNADDITCPQKEFDIDDEDIELEIVEVETTTTFKPIQLKDVV